MDEDRIQVWYLHGEPELKRLTPVAMYWTTRRLRSRGTTLTVDEALSLAERLLAVVREVREDQEIEL